MVVLVSLLFTTYVHFTRSYSFFSKYWTYYQTQLVPIWCHFITLCHSRFFFKTALFFHLQIKPKVKNLLAVVHFQKVFKEKFQRDIFLTTVQLQMHLLRMCKTGEPFLNWSVMTNPSQDLRKPFGKQNRNYILTLFRVVFNVNY